MMIAPESTRPASFLRHLAAMLYDSFLLLACIILIGFIFFFLNGMEAVSPQDPLRHVLFAAMLATSWLFYAYFWSKQSQTLGMRAWRLVVVDAHGRSPGFWQASLRWFMALMGLLLLGVGLWWRLFDREKRTLYDIFSHTRLYVLKENPYKKVS